MWRRCLLICKTNHEIWCLFCQIFESVWFKISSETNLFNISEVVLCSSCSYWAPDRQGQWQLHFWGLTEARCVCLIQSPPDKPGKHQTTALFCSETISVSSATSSGVVVFLIQKMMTKMSSILFPPRHSVWCPMGSVGNITEKEESPCLKCCPLCTDVRETDSVGNT